MAFVIDTTGQQDLLSDKVNNIVSNNESDDDDDFQFLPFPSKPDTTSTKSRSTGKHAGAEIDFDDTYLDFGDASTSSRARSQKITTNSLARQMNNPDKLLQKSVLQPGVEKLHALPSYDEGRRQLLKKRKMEREKSAGRNWFNMQAPEITEEMKNDLEVLKMRSALDPKHFYKKNDFKNLPKYFQVGRVVESAADFYHSRIPKKDRKKTLVDELLADAEFQKSTKKRYKEIIAEKQKTHYKAHRQAKRLKKNKK
ncbi:Deoxynucleotidyltransferase terminal-interacting protein 2 [Frankliniella fusca]|uniref:Deoxynucleotidyltransferase terminal-interacting protein 2 n=1 Tax=Frankliniella fusca TaxID=407009 RepID=A0AAE1HVE2_9NEOP|nr:Deoxynucleotidyltransferase terminal-interacting protein 2 [Frankliniella fusca]